MAYGLRPANTAGAGYHTGGFVEYKIGTLGTAIFNGSCVTMTAGAGINVLAVPLGNAATTAGVLVGARWTNSEGEIKFGQSYDGASTNTDAYAFVALASDTIFRIQGTAGFVENQRGTARPFTTGTPLTGSAITGNSNLTCDNDVAQSRRRHHSLLSMSLTMVNRQAQPHRTFWFVFLVAQFRT